MSWKEPETWKLVAAVIAVLTTVVTLAVAIWRRSRKRVAAMTEWVRRLNSAIEELRPNGGRSIRDRIKRIDTTVQINAARVHVIMERDQMPIYECLPTGECSYANRSLCELFGLESEEMEGNGWLAALIPEDRERVFDTWRSAVAKQIPYECSYSLRTKAGVEKVTTTAEPMWDTDGNLIGYHGILWRQPSQS